MISKGRATAREAAARLLLVTGSVAACALVAETGLRVAGYEPARFQAPRQLEGPQLRPPRGRLPYPPQDVREGPALRAGHRGPCDGAQRPRAVEGIRGAPDGPRRLDPRATAPGHRPGAVPARGLAARRVRAR